LIGTHVNVTMGELRSIRVFVLGEAESPASTPWRLSTMTNALFVSGGVKRSVPLRNIQLKREWTLVTTLDLYICCWHVTTAGQSAAARRRSYSSRHRATRCPSMERCGARPFTNSREKKTVAQAIEIAGGCSRRRPKAGQLERILPSSCAEMRMSI